MAQISNLTKKTGFFSMIFGAGLALAVAGCSDPQYGTIGGGGDKEKGKDALIHPLGPPTKSNSAAKSNAPEVETTAGGKLKMVMPKASSAKKK